MARRKRLSARKQSHPGAASFRPLLSKRAFGWRDSIRSRTFSCRCQRKKSGGFLEDQRPSVFQPSNCAMHKRKRKLGCVGEDKPPSINGEPNSVPSIGRQSPASQRGEQPELDTTRSGFPHHHHTHTAQPTGCSNPWAGRRKPFGLDIRWSFWRSYLHSDRSLSHSRCE